MGKKKITEDSINSDETEEILEQESTSFEHITVKEPVLEVVQFTSIDLLKPKKPKKVDFKKILKQSQRFY